MVVLALLEKLGLIGVDQVQKLAKFERRSIYNWRRLEVGEIRPCFYDLTMCCGVYFTAS